MADLSCGGPTPYFPPLYGTVECRKCELFGTCPSCDRYQRSRRDFTYTSGRCPRLPDWRGFMAPEQQELYASLFPLVHAERGENKAIRLTLKLPQEERARKVYRTASGYWYFRDRFEGQPVKRVLAITEGCDMESILHIMDAEWSNHSVFRCTIEDYFV